MHRYIVNAIPTAEGALQIALEEMPVTLCGAKCLVAGNGRIGKVLSQRLKNLCADVTVSARKAEDFAKITVQGLKYCQTTQIGEIIGDFELVVNTIPAMVFTSSVLAKADNDCLIIDLASKPGGVDMQAAQKLGKKVIWALSLPGKVAPKTAAGAVKKTILNIMEERGMQYG